MLMILMVYLVNMLMKISWAQNHGHVLIFPGKYVYILFSKNAKILYFI
jgi:hypothetical protein